MKEISQEEFIKEACRRCAKACCPNLQDFRCMFYRDQNNALPFRKMFEVAIKVFQTSNGTAKQQRALQAMVDLYKEYYHD